MPILKYWWPQDEDQIVGQPQSTFLAENADWWNGTFQLGAQIALAAALALAALQSTQATALANSWQDDPQLSAKPDEDFWINPVLPVPGSLVPLQQWTFDEQFPSLFGQFDEDSWSNPASPALSIIPYIIPSLSPDQSEIVPQPPATVVPDEDFWQNPAAAVLLAAAARTLILQPFSFDDVIIVPFVPPPPFAPVDRIIVLRDVFPGIRVRPPTYP
jgi:hypothetical protein